MLILAAAFGAAGLAEATAESPGVKLDFNRDVRPILSENCFRCHGFDEKARKAGLRLDVLEGAVKPAKSGAIAVVPRQPEKSELVARITADDPGDRMPPDDSDKKLSAGQVEVLRRWIAEGASYAKHWAFITPAMTMPPPVKQTSWPRNEIDVFVLARLEESELQPQSEASPEMLLRRVSLDLTGLPPTIAELDTFLNDRRQGAYERAVDRLLASERYGERMAVDWLDAARYADTNGYFSDKPRQMWPWRDWVIRAFNQNLPFDQFTIEQLAGDLLPSASLEQKIATGFSRNSMANNESGIIDEEYRVEYIVDRLDATATTWMGITLGCAQCHDHKFDPVSQKEFYQLFAFFNNTPDTGLIKSADPPPTIAVPSTAQKAKLSQLAERHRRLMAEFAPSAAALKKQIEMWEPRACSELKPPPADGLTTAFDFEENISRRDFCEAGGGTLEYLPGVLGSAAKFDGTKHIEASGDLGIEADRSWTIALWIKGEGSLSGVFSKIEPIGSRRGVEMIWQKGTLQVNLVHRWGVKAIEVVTREPLKAGQWTHVTLSYDGSRKAVGLQVLLNGRSAALDVYRDTLDGSIANREPLRLGRRDANLGFYGQLDEFRVLSRSVAVKEAEAWFWSERVRGIIATPAAKREAREIELLQNYFVDHHASRETQAAHRAVVAAKEAEAAFRTQIPTVLVMQEMDKLRASHVLMRGQYDQPGEAVTPNVPAAIAGFPAGAPRNRLGFARWLVAPSNPLTARVIVNRLWQQCFGEGLVRTVNDFGSQGEPPTHLQLLDWLAVRFQQSDWDVKALLRLIVTSATYRQSSSLKQSKGSRVETTLHPVVSAHQRFTPSTGLPEFTFDPDNRLLSRGPQFRLSAEMLRDQALAAAGLLSTRIGGPSVKPYQPPGLWEAVSYNGEETYVPDHGESLWRRTLYTFWKRQAPPPGTLAFDGPTREKCVVRRARTNTPLQALVLLNDDTFVEAARALAAVALRADKQKPANDASLRQMFRRVLSRFPEADELDLLKALLEKQCARFAADPAAAERLLSVGESKSRCPAAPAELAAWTVVAQTILNLDEAITRR